MKHYSIYERLYIIRKKVFKILIIIFFAFLILNTIKEVYEEKNIKIKNYGEEKVIRKIEIGEQNNIKGNVNLNLVDEKYKGYETVAKLKIPKLNIDTYVLSNFSKDALEVCVTKFWGPNPNEIGNFCIAGHNYITKNMFSKLYTLEKGDQITLVDNKNGVVKYNVYDIFKVMPSEIEVLNQQTNGSREITLITCTNYSNQRIIVKAREMI